MSESPVLRSPSDAAILHAHFEAAVLLWELRRGSTFVSEGAFPADTADPVDELRELEIRMGATVRIKASDLGVPDLAFALSCGWQLI